MPSTDKRDDYTANTTQEVHNAHDVRQKLARQTAELEAELARFRRQLLETQTEVPIAPPRKKRFWPLWS